MSEIRKTGVLYAFMYYIKWGVPLAERRDGSTIRISSMNKTASSTSPDSLLDLPIFFIVQLGCVSRICTDALHMYRFLSPSTIFFMSWKFYNSGYNEVAHNACHSVHSMCYVYMTYRKNCIVLYCRHNKASLQGYFI